MIQLDLSAGTGVHISDMVFIMWANKPIQVKVAGIVQSLTGQLALIVDVMTDVRAEIVVENCFLTREELIASL